MHTWRPVLLAALGLTLHLTAAAAPRRSPPVGPATLAAPTPAAVAVTGVRLNEILAGPARDWDGSGAFSSRDDEWIEIANAGATVADLAGFFVTDGDSIPRYAFSGTLGPLGTRLVTGKMSYDWEKLAGQPAFGLSLGNTGDSVILWQVTGADTVLVDTYTFKSHEAAADRSAGRAPDSGQWVLYDGLNPYTGTLTPSGNACAPTPGAVNTCTASPAHPATWGALKAAYR